MKNRLIKILLIINCLLVFFLEAKSQDNVRKILNLNDSWVIYPACNVSPKVEKKEVTIPHTWNSSDCFDKINYSREAMVYQRNLTIGKELSEKRLFLYFEGVNSVANVFVNGKLVGEHFGGYTAFCFEITNFVDSGKDAALSVFVSNAYRTDVLPLSGDFNVYGGIHRPVHLIITDKNCISPLDFASSCVYIKPQIVSATEAKFKVETKLSLNELSQNLEVRTTILDADHHIVAHETKPLASGDQKEIDQTFSINKPVLWNGKDNPYCYQVKVELLEKDKIIDAVTETTGFRYFSVDAENGFHLNGRYLDLHGFGMHEDIAGKGSAYTPEDFIGDMSLVKESGATALRLAHYPHGKMIYDLSDNEGIILWTEIPFVGPGGYTGPGYVKSDLLEKNTKNMLIEMIRQNYNHPSVLFWGLFNELKDDFDDPVPFVKELNALAKKEDPYRLTTCASFGNQENSIGITDLIGWNEYFGWYGGTPKEIGTFTDKLKEKLKGQPICISEYGAGASITTHQWPVEKPDPGSKFHPEEWQTIYHEGNWKELSARKYIWGKFVWNFADLSSSVRNEGDKQGINDKGLITYDHKIKKDAFYFYKATWNPEPMVYITSRRFVERTNRLTDVKVFTNATKADLFINGTKISTQEPDNQRTIIWSNVELQPGKNSIEVKAKLGQQQLEDSCIWTFTQN